MHISSCLDTADRNDPYEVKFAKLRYFWGEQLMQSGGVARTPLNASDTEEVVTVIKLRSSLKCILNNLNNLQFYKTPNHDYLCKKFKDKSLNECLQHVNLQCARIYGRIQLSSLYF